MTKSILRLDANAPLEDGELPDNVLEGNPLPSEQVSYKSPDEKVFTGVWACEPGIFTGENYPVDEMIVIIEGKLGMIDLDDGSEQIFEKGDVFVIAKGANTKWVVYEKVKKFYMVVE